jgi:hypothetical protein
VVSRKGKATRGNYSDVAFIATSKSKSPIAVIGSRMCCCRTWQTVQAEIRIIDEKVADILMFAVLHSERNAALVQVVH